MMLAKPTQWNGIAWNSFALVSFWYASLSTQVNTPNLSLPRKDGVETHIHRCSQLAAFRILIAALLLIDLRSWAMTFYEFMYVELDAPFPQRVERSTRRCSTRNQLGGSSRN